jgi:hypothetical protein
MYNASLDAFRANSWYFNIYQSYYSRLYWTSSLARVANSTEFNEQSNDYHSLPSRYYDALNYFGLGFYSNYYYRGYGEGAGSGPGRAYDGVVAEEMPAMADQVSQTKSAPAPRSGKESKR